MGIPADAAPLPLAGCKEMGVDDHPAVGSGQAITHPDQERCSDDREAEYQPPPEPHGAQARDEPQKHAERETQEPVPEQVDEHRATGIADPSEDARSYRLESIEDLEDAGNRDQRRSDRDDLQVSAVETGEGFWEHEKERRRSCHESGAAGESRPSRSPRAARISPSDRLAYEH